MKKFVSLLLVLSLAFAVMAPVAFATGYERLPIVYIRGNGEPLYDSEGNLLATDLKNLSLGDDSEDGAEGEEDTSAKDAIVEAAVNILKPFVLEGMIFDEWDNYGKAIYEELAPLFGDAGLDENGNPKNGTGVDASKLAASERDSKSAWRYNNNYEYEFCFDWRLSPYDHVDRLHQYILNILAATGKTQINMYGRCLGGGLLMAYLERYGHLGHIKNVMFADILSNETTVISKAMSGKVEFDANFMQNYLGQLDFCGNKGYGDGFVFTDLLNEIVFSTMDFFNQISVTDKALDEVEALYGRLYKALIPAILHASGMATQVNYWTGIAEDDMDDALNLIFGEEGSDVRKQYAGLIDKILYYREHVSSDLTAFYDGLKENNIHFGFIAKYGFLNAPFTEEAYLSSDALVSLTHATFGATTAPVGKTLSEEYINARIEEGFGKYISADKTVDLSTAYSPDTTWIIKNAHHDIFEPYRSVVYEFLNGTNKTVDTVSSGTQFMVYDCDTKKISEMTEENCGDLDFMKISEEKPTTISILTAFFRFMSMLINMLRSIFNGTFDFGNLFG